MLLPGKPQSTPQAVCAGVWQRKRIIAYISGPALSILTGPEKLLQTIYQDTPLYCVELDAATGKLAFTTDHQIFVYKPTITRDGCLKWELQTMISVSPSDGFINSVSWGDSEEILVGSNTITLWSTSNRDTADTRLLWRKLLANKAISVKFSPDASLAVSISHNDRLVKVWRKISLGSDVVQFDFSYLPHSRAVLSMHWRQRLRAEDSADNVLYTVSEDQILRVWGPIYPHDVHLLQLWAVVDFRVSPSSRRLDGFNQKLFSFVIDSKLFRLAAEAAVCLVGAGDRERGILQRLIEVATRNPEVVVAFDMFGKMSAWGLENVGCQSRKATNVFSIVQDETSGLEDWFLKFCGNTLSFTPISGEEGMVMLLHSWDGQILWIESRLDQFLDPLPRRSRFFVKTVWTGHASSVCKLTRSADGKVLLSSTVDDEHCLWSKVKYGDSVGLQIQNCLPELAVRVRHACIIDEGRHLITLHEDHVILWNTKIRKAKELDRIIFEPRDEFLCLLVLPEVNDQSRIYRVVAVGAKLTGIALEINVFMHDSDSKDAKNTTGSIKLISQFNLGLNESVLAVVSVDPVGWNAVLSENLDMFSREVMTTVCSSGLLISWTVKVFPEIADVKWLATSRVHTGVRNPSLAKGNSIRKIALVDETKSELTIWDSKTGNLEYRKRFRDKDSIYDLDWTSTPQNQSILAVGFPDRVILMCQLRYDYLKLGPAWAGFREISIQNMTDQPIGDSIWLDEGRLVVGAGNQLFVCPRKIHEFDKTLDSLHLTSHHVKIDDIFDVVAELNGPLPTYHPQFLQQCIMAGKINLAECILVNLCKELTNYHEEVELDRFMNIPIAAYFSEEGLDFKNKHVHSSPMMDSVEDAEITSFGTKVTSRLSRYLKSIPIPRLTGPEQISLASIVESMAQLEQHRRAIDQNGALYMLFFRQHTLRRDKGIQDISFREITWAFHSESQDIMVDFVNQNSQNRMLWPQARESGIFLWLRDHLAIKNQFEVLARNHYTHNDNKNPVDCTLYYLVLKKKNILTGLWRIASENMEQSATYRFLSNNFAESRWKTAAMKNAYALLGKHRFEYAAAFFLLADSLKDAVNVCCVHLDDIQLAIGIARAYEGDEGPVLRNLLESKVLPLAAKEGDRWLATWAFWMLSKRDMAVRALLSPLDSLILGAVKAPKLGSRMFLLDDPALLIFYKQIREKTVQTLRGAEKIIPEQEFQFVLRTASLYDRMGCDLLALDLVKNWDFLTQDGDIFKPLIEAIPKAHHFKRRSSITMVDTLPVNVTNLGRGNFKPMNFTIQSTVAFEEPDMSWAF